MRSTFRHRVAAILVFALFVQGPAALAGNCFAHTGTDSDSNSHSTMAMNSDLHMSMPMAMAEPQSDCHDSMNKRIATVKADMAADCCDGCGCIAQFSILVNDPTLVGSDLANSVGTLSLSNYRYNAPNPGTPPPIR